MKYVLGITLLLGIALTMAADTTPDSETYQGERTADTLTVIFATIVTLMLEVLCYGLWRLIAR